MDLFITIYGKRVFVWKLMGLQSEAHISGEVYSLKVEGEPLDLALMDGEALKLLNSVKMMLERMDLGQAFAPQKEGKQ